MAKRRTRAQKLQEKLDHSRTATDMNRTLGELMLTTRSRSDAARFMRALKKAVQPAVMRLGLSVLTTDDITRLGKDEIPPLEEINASVNALTDDINRAMYEIGDDIPEWVNYISDPTREKSLNDTIFASTLEGVNASFFPDVNAALAGDETLVDLVTRGAPKSDINARKAQIRVVYSYWDKLDPKGRDIYKKAFDRMRHNFDKRQRVLLEIIAKSGLEGSPDDSNTPLGRLMASVTQQFEETRRRGVYFPLMRFGEFWLRLGNKPEPEFMMFESAVARNIALEKLHERLVSENYNRSIEEMLEDGTISQGDGARGARQEIARDSVFLKEIFAKIDDAALGDKEALKDAIYEMYLHTLPEVDIRKQFSPRKGRTGFSTDALRSYIVSNMRTATQVARLKHIGDIRNAAADAYDAVRGRPNEAALTVIVDEMVTRATEEASPTMGSPGTINWDKLSGIANKAAFIWFLSSPKSALIQMTQLPIVGLPVLSAKYGTAATWATAARYMFLFNKVGISKLDSKGNIVSKIAPPNLGTSRYLNNHPNGAAMKAAWLDAQERGLFSSTFTADITQRGNIASASYSTPAARAGRATMTLMTGLFHHTERLSREIAFMSAYELAHAAAVKRGDDYPDAVAREEAQKSMYEALFNYTNYNKPRAFKNPVGKMTFQFLTYPLQMTSLLVRNFYGMLPLLDKKGKKEAATVFFGTLGMTAMFAGTTGMLGYSVFMGIAEGLREMMRDDDDEFYDSTDDGNPLGKRDLDLWFRTHFLPQYFGDGFAREAVQSGPISAATGIDFGSSTALNGLWFRDDSKAPTTERAVQEAMLGLFGPVGGLVQMGGKAFDEFERGNFSRGVENLLPAVFRNPVKAARLADEGLQTPSNQLQVVSPEHYTFGVLLAQSLGFSNLSVAEQQKVAVLKRRLAEEMEKDRGKVYEKIDRAVRMYDNNPTDSNDAAIERAFEEIEKYNMRYPQKIITMEGVQRALDQRRRNREEAIEGVLATDEMAPYVAEAMSIVGPDEGFENE